MSVPNKFIALNRFATRLANVDFPIPGVPPIRIINGLNAFFSLKEIGPWLLDQPEVFPFMITLNDEALHRKRLLKEEQLTHQKISSDSFDAIRKIQNYLLEGSEEIGIQIIDNHSSEETIETILDVIVSKMKPQLEK